MFFDANAKPSPAEELDWAGVIQKQQRSFDAIRSIQINFKKDGPSRRTVEYLKRRLDTLEAQWGEFDGNNNILQRMTDKRNEYFVENIYERTKAIYEEVKQDIKACQLKLSLDIPQQSPGDEGAPSFDRIVMEQTNDTTNNDTGNKDLQAKKTKDMLRLQFLNFNALERAIEKSDLNSMDEKWELEDCLAILKARWDAIDKNHWELNFILNGSLAAYGNEYLKWENRYDALKKNISRKIWANAHYQKTTPKMDIPEFDGKYNKWVSFRDLFIETVHTNPLLSKSQKMQHLKSKLVGDAEKLVQHLTISAENYHSCWDIIEHRYENKRLLFSSYANTLLKLPTIQHPSAFNVRRMHDTIKECINGLINLGLDISTWDPIIVHLLLPKLDAATYSEYTQTVEKPRDLPSLRELTDFLEAKFMAFETLEQNQNSNKQEVVSKKPAFVQQKSAQKNFNFYNKYNDQGFSNYKKPERFTKSYHTTSRTCPLCKKGHALMHCTTFLSMDATARNENVAKLQICRNCLFSHNGRECISNRNCKVCNKNHHTLLHSNELENYRGQSRPHQQPSTSNNRSTNHVNCDDQEVLLTTVKLMVKNIEGNYIALRALLDQGSQVSLVTENAAQRLRLPRRKQSAVVSGVGTSQGNSKGCLTIECKSIHSDFTFTTDVLVMRKLINNLPSSTLNKDKWEYLENLKLADPDFHVSGPVDILLGADIYSRIINDGVLRHDVTSPVAQHTKLGWILCGNVKTLNCLVTLNELENLNRFWETEEVNYEGKITNSEEYCEKHYKETTVRLSTGQYVVKMPLKNDIQNKLGKTRPQAISQFMQLERKMAKQQQFAERYKQFIAEYEELGHMKLAQEAPNTTPEAYLPHHGVIREDSTTTKLRVVFNASMKSDTKYSLNDLMEKGPNLQKDITSLILTWRSYEYALTADIEKMFRAILLHEDQQPLQKIIWRPSPRDRLQERQLCTVTYGTKAAPFLAMRTLQQLADDEGQAHPVAEKALRHQFYMDDVITGHHTLEGARELQKQLYELLRKGGFTLRKWASNNPAVLTNIPEKHRSTQDVLNFHADESMKTLGLIWNKSKDLFGFNWELAEENKANTKRKMLADISKIFDPLGWIAPIIINTKILFQQVWSSNIGWDEAIPAEIAIEWEKLRLQLKLIKNITIPRWINCVNNIIELHGFCDASEKAIACVIYSRTITKLGQVVTTLLTAKTRVAPLKKKPTLPRLELCGARLLAELMGKVKAALAEYELRVYCWTDSQVVLAWLQGSSSKWESYITNRTTFINNIVPATQWRHVKTKENPADCASRGLLPSQLLNFKLWWEGPEWLKTWTQNDLELEEKFQTTHGKVVECNIVRKQGDCVIKQITERCSTLSRATRVVAWVLRFKTKLQNKTQSPGVSHLTIEELNEATQLIIIAEQRENFSMEINDLIEGRTINRRSKILNLTPFLDEKGILRVGGRLRHSTLPEEAKHPAILPHAGHLTSLIINDAHQRMLHGGARLTLAETRQKFWIMGGNRAVKGIIQLCVQCRRYKASNNNQIMGNLPSARVTPSRPFTHTGVDFTGHIEIKLNKGRGVTTCKGYIAIFICLVTKAVHIELVSDLTAQTFLAALSRMCARRGTPAHMYSDNATNFKGAANILEKEFKEYGTLTSPAFFKGINDLKIQWHFLCPRWASAAGIWESGVRTIKHHLSRTLKDEKLTFEQLTTLLSQIEACMNSRPLCPLTEDVEDLEYLTPGHFLTGSAMMSLPREDHTQQNLDLRNKWRRVELMHQHIWNRWSKEYLHRLQTKSKWLHPKENIQTGDLVLVKEDNVPPGRWAMGRVLDLHPGDDGYVRVVTLKTQAGTFRRPIVKLVPLPTKENTQANNQENQSIQKTNSDSKPQKQSHPTSRSKRTGRVATTILSVLLTLFTCVNTQPTPPVVVTSIEGNKPIYFDKIGNLQLIHDEWKLLVYYNLTTYWQGTAKVEKYINDLSGICGRLNNSSCEPVIAQLQHELQQITDYNTLLLSHHLIRRKRGYFNGVGNLAHTLFGVLDENFASKYQDDIERVQENENYLLELLKNQTSIVETENNIIKNNENFMRSQLETIHHYLEEANITLTKIVYIVEKMETVNDLNAASLTANMILWNLKQTQDTLLNTLTNIHNGHLDVHLLTPRQLAYQLNMIAAKISKRLTLPVKNVEDDIKEVYKLLYVRARVTSHYLLLEVHIPLMSDDEYNVFQIVPLVMYGPSNETLSIIPSSSHIAVNFGKETYISVKEKDLEQCVKMKDNNLICNTNYPIHDLRNENTPCEAGILSQQTTRHCNMVKVKCIDDWIKLHKSNRWLYLCCGACQARVICNDNITITKLMNIGTIDIREGCILQKRDITLFAYNHFGSTLELESSIPDTPDVNLHLNEDIQLNLSSVLHSTIDNKQVEEHHQLDEKILLQKKNEKLPVEKLTTHDVHQYSVLYCLVAAFCLAGIYALVKHCKKRAAQRTIPEEPKAPPKKPERNPKIRSQDEVRRWQEQGGPTHQELQRSGRIEQRQFNFDMN